MTKICTKCGIEKELNWFSKKKNGKYGVNSICKICKRKISVEYNKKHKEERKRYAEEHKEQIALYKHQYYEEHKEEKRIYDKNYRETRKEHYKAVTKHYRETHRESILQYNRNKKDAYCVKGRETEIENYDIAKLEGFSNWHRHHRLETHNSDGEKRLVQLSTEELIALDMYYNRPPEELIFLKKSEHARLHQTMKKYSND